MQCNLDDQIQVGNTVEERNYEEAIQEQADAAFEGCKVSGIKNCCPA
jgi:hypothetical protein